MRIRDIKNSDPGSTYQIRNTDCVLNFLQYMYLEDPLGSCVGGASIPRSWASWGRRQRRRLAWPTLILLTLILAWGAVVLQLLTQQLQSINSETNLRAVGKLHRESLYPILSLHGNESAICYIRINHYAQIFLARPSVWSCERHGCNPLEMIPADLSDAGWAKRPYSFWPSRTPALHLLY